MPADQKSIEWERLLEVFLGWKRATGRAFSLNLARKDLLDGFVPGIVFLALLGIQPMDEFLWQPSELIGSEPCFLSVYSPLAPRSFQVVEEFMLAVFLLHAAMFFRLLVHRRRAFDGFRRWVVITSGFAGGIPMFGYMVFPFWRWIEKKRPRWALAPIKPDCLLLQATARWHSLTSRTVSEPGIPLAASVGLLIANAISFYLPLFWLARAAKEGRVPTSVVAIASLSIHILIFGIAQCLFIDPGVRRNLLPLRRALFILLSIVLALPLPYLPFLGFFAFGLGIGRLKLSDTLAWQPLAKRSSTSRLPLWIGLQNELAQGWNGARWAKRIRLTPDPLNRQILVRKNEARILQFYDLKTRSLILDSTCLGWWLSWIAENPARKAGINAVFSGLVLVPLAIGAAAFFLIGLHHVLKLLRISPSWFRLLDHAPYATYSARGYMALSIGLYVGAMLRQKDSRSTADFIVSLCMIPLSVKAIGTFVVHFIPGTQRDKHGYRGQIQDILILALLAVLGSIGGSRIIPFWLITSPLRFLITLFFFLPWLLRPFTWKSIFEPAFPGRLRRSFLALFLTAVFPFGGLAIPLCLYIRDQRWAEASSIWAKSHPTGELASQEPPEPSLADLQLERTF